MLSIESRFTKTAIAATLCLSLGACASVQTLGYGTVKQQKLIKKSEHLHSKSTYVGGGVGALSGAVLAGTAAGLASIYCLFASPICVPIVLGGAAVGAGVGALAGGGLGYLNDESVRGIGKFHYVVQPKYQLKQLEITQYSNSSMPRGTKVKIQKRTMPSFSHKRSTIQIVPMRAIR